MHVCSPSPLLHKKETSLGQGGSSSDLTLLKCSLDIFLHWYLFVDGKEYILIYVRGSGARDQVSIKYTTIKYLCSGPGRTWLSMLTNSSCSLHTEKHAEFHSILERSCPALSQGQQTPITIVSF